MSVWMLVVTGLILVKGRISVNMQTIFIFRTECQVIDIHWYLVRDVGVNPSPQVDWIFPDFHFSSTTRRGY